jgi:hypothetical protein
VLGADRAAVRGDEPQHQLVDRGVVRLRAEDVHVQVAVADMPIGDRPGIWLHGGHDGGRALHELRVATDRHRHVQLVGHALGVHRLGVALAQLP